MKRFSAKSEKRVGTSRWKELLTQGWQERRHVQKQDVLGDSDEVELVLGGETTPGVKSGSDFSQHIDLMLRERQSGRYARKKRRKHWIATSFSLICPGLGHLYQRRWLEAMFWMSLALGVVCCAVGLTGKPEIAWVSLIGVGVIAAIGNFRSYLM